MGLWEQCMCGIRSRGGGSFWTLRDLSLPHSAFLLSSAKSGKLILLLAHFLTFSVGLQVPWHFSSLIPSPGGLWSLHKPHRTGVGLCQRAVLTGFERKTAGKVCVIWSLIPFLLPETSNCRLRLELALRNPWQVCLEFSFSC